MSYNGDKLREAQAEQARLEAELQSLNSLPNPPATALEVVTTKLQQAKEAVEKYTAYIVEENARHEEYERQQAAERARIKASCDTAVPWMVKLHVSLTLTLKGKATATLSEDRIRVELPNVAYANDTYRAATISVNGKYSRKIPQSYDRYETVYEPQVEVDFGGYGIVDKKAKKIVQLDDKAILKITREVEEVVNAFVTENNRRSRKASAAEQTQTLVDGLGLKNEQADVITGIDYGTSRNYPARGKYRKVTRTRSNDGLATLDVSPVHQTDDGTVDQVMVEFTVKMTPERVAALVATIEDFGYSIVRK